MSAIHTYLLYGLEATPVVLTKLLKGASPEIFDHRFDPDRFTLREVIAHLADLEGVWNERVNAILVEEGAAFQGRDPEVFMKADGFQSMNPAQFLEKFSSGRAQFVQTLKTLSDESWTRYGMHSQMGKMTIHEMAQFVLGHDGYHLQQVAEWVDSQ